METDPHASLDKELDHFVDTGQGSYSDAWEHSGVTPPDNADFTGEAIRARNEQLAFSEADDQEPDLSDDDLKPIPGNYKNGYDRPAWRRHPEETQRKAQAGVAAARAAIRGE